MKNEDIKYSIIIPHHNIPHLLQRCLDSIPERDDVQIIVVDDNSDEDVVDFDNFSGKERTNVQLVFTKESKGAGYARNVGLSYAKGQWVLFADADDYFNYCINDILDEYIHSESDIVFFNANSVDSQTYLNENRTKYLNEYILMYKRNRERKKAIDLLKYKFGEPWSKLIKRSLIISNKIKFDEVLIHNDTTFSYLVSFYSSKISVDERALYCVTKRNGSVSRTIDDVRLLTRIEVFSRSSKFFKEHGICVDENRHYLQLAYCYWYNKPVFKRGFMLMRKKGYEKMEIILGMVFPAVKLLLKNMLGYKKG